MNPSNSFWSLSNINATLLDEDTWLETIGSMEMLLIGELESEGNDAARRWLQQGMAQQEQADRRIEGKHWGI